MTRALAWLVLAVVSSAAWAEDSKLSAQQEEGKRLYHQTCVHCHAPGIWGTHRLSRRMDPGRAVLENRTDLPAAAVSAIIRAGFGSMPAYRRTELTDDQVAAIAAYVARNVKQP